MNAVVSAISLIYFSQLPSNQSFNYFYGLSVNIINLISYIIALSPLLICILKKRKKTSATEEYYKHIALSKIAFPIFSSINLLLSVVCLFGLISQIFKWKYYDYLFISFCLVGASLSIACSYLKIRTDCMVVFSLQTYKFFLLIIGTIIFGIIAIQDKIDTLAIAFAWVSFVYHAKESLGKSVFYYLMVLLQFTIEITGCIMIVSYSTKMNKKQIFVFMFFLLLLVKQILEVKETLKTYESDLSFRIKKINPPKIYYSIANYERNSSEVNPEIGQACSICLENGNQPLVSLPCHHTFHIDCIYKWVLINECCPLCRKQIVLEDNEEQLGICY